MKPFSTISNSCFSSTVLNSSNTDTRDGNSERVPTQNTLDDSTSGSEVGIWEKQLEELEVKQSRGDQLTDAEKNKLKKSHFDKVAETSQKNELENLFVECIEEIRKDIMKRRLKNEIFNKKKFQ